MFIKGLRVPRVLGGRKCWQQGAACQAAGKRAEAGAAGGASELNLTLMRLIEHMRTPHYGARQMVRHLRREGSAWALAEAYAELAGGLASLCGVKAGANTCANPVGATAAPF